MFSEHVVCHVLCVTCVFCAVVNGKRSVCVCVCVCVCKCGDCGDCGVVCVLFAYVFVCVCE
jgi:hypothetical protein